MNLEEVARTRIHEFVKILPRLNTLQINVEFQAIRGLISIAPQACIPVVTFMTRFILHGGDAWQNTMIVARGLVDGAPELHGLMREQWRDALSFQILANNSDGAMREIAVALDLASDKPDHGSLGIARAMTPDDPRPLFIIGAGFSYDSMPLTQELEALVVGLLAGREIRNPVALLKDNWQEVWRLLASDPVTFKQRFIGFSQATSPAMQHLVLRNALDLQKIVGVISFNWDDHVERASAVPIEMVRSEGEAINGPGLWKMHGDVNAPELPWVWPHEEGRALVNVTDYVIAQAQEGRISHVVVIGYGERERNIQKALLEPLEKMCPNWIRVRPTGQEGPSETIAKSARRFMGELESFQDAVTNGIL